MLLGMVDVRKKKVYAEIFEELEALAMHDEQLQEAFTVWQKLSRSPEETSAYESRLKYILDEEAKWEDAKYMGKKEGIMEVALKMIAKGASNEEISDLTGLTMEEVEVLRT